MIIKLFSWLAEILLLYVVRSCIEDEDISTSDVRIRSLLRNEIKTLPRTIEQCLLTTDAEAELISRRLTRRYDPALAMVEATNRAIVKKAEARAEEDGMGLTDKQKLAMDFQKKDLARRLRIS